MTRRLVLAIVLFGLAGAPLRAQSPTFFHRDTLPTRTALSRVGLERQWSGVVPLGYTDERVLMISHAGTMLFAQTNKANFHAYDAETGRYLWGLNLGRHTMSARPVSVNSDRVFVTNSTDLYSIDRRTGRVIWKALLGGLPSSATAADEDYVLVGLRSGMVVAYTVRDMSHDNPPGPAAAGLAWSWKTDAEVTSPPIVTKHVTAFASQDKRVYVATNQSPPILLHRYLTNGPIVAAMGTHGTRTLLVPSSDDNVYAIDLFTSDTRWVFASGAPVVQEPLAARDEVFVLNKDGRLSAIDAVTGQARWDVYTAHGQLQALSRSRVYLRTREGDLMIADRSDGRVIADARATRERSGLNLREYNLALTNRVDDRLYYGTASGALICIRELGATRPYLLRDLKAPIFGYIPAEGEGQPAAAGNAGAAELPPEPDAAAAPPEEKPSEEKPAEAAPPKAGDKPADAPKPKD